MFRFGSRIFAELWTGDVEYRPRPGERPAPLVLVAHELLSGRRLEVFGDELLRLSRPPFPVGDESLFISYYLPAELGIFLACGWSLPRHLCCLYTEFRALTNGRTLTAGRTLLGALAFFGLPGMDAAAKEAYRELAIHGPQTPDDWRALSRYCAADVDANIALWTAMRHYLDGDRSLLRGQYHAVVAEMEFRGIPIDTEALELLRAHWDELRAALVAEVDNTYGIYDGLSFRQARFAAWLEQHEIPWPRLASGSLRLDDDTWKEMARRRPVLEPLRQVRKTLALMRGGIALPVGADGRARCMLSPYGTITGRNAPKSSEFIFAYPAWLRSLVRPAPGRVIAYIDWCSQEHGIAAALSRDAQMMRAYQTGDPYLAAAIDSGRAPPGATKATHGSTRERFKVVLLAPIYGMREHTLARQLDCDVLEARAQLARLHRAYSQFWAWSDAAVDLATQTGRITTVFGWPLEVDALTNVRRVRNFVVQGNGAEMLRLAACFTVAAGVELIATVHDALVIEANASERDDAVRATQAAMDRASAVVLDGFVLRTEVKCIQYPDRFHDPRGGLWGVVQRLLEDTGGVSNLA
jgi:DNA polymerase I